MNNIILAQLYAQKGKLITNIELASEELKIIKSGTGRVRNNSKRSNRRVDKPMQG